MSVDTALRTQPELRTLFTQNRSEEIGNDVWRLFVVPPFFDRLELGRARKPRIVVGGRGSGKTMLLRYLSHQSTFSQDRPEVPAQAIEHIGLYWRADTQFAQLLRGRGHTPETWASAFEHLIGLAVGVQVLESIQSIAASRCPALDRTAPDQLDLSPLSAYHPALAGDHAGALAALRRQLRELEAWVRNAERQPPPIFLPGAQFVAALIETICEQLPGLARALFFVYVDEYENLQESQQRIINTYLKHSQKPLIFNVAVKRYGVVTQQTTGEESISDIADYREHDIEAYLESDFKLFAAEVLLLTLALADIVVPLDVELVRDPTRLAERRAEPYREQVVSFARALFPGLTEEQLASALFADASALKRLRRRVEQQLTARGSQAGADAFVRPGFPQASVVSLALLARRLSDREIIAELDQLERGEPNRFTGSADWIHNNFVGTLLALSEPDARVSAFYAGFDTFCALARANMRHFLELCHRALNRSAPTSGRPDRAARLTPVPPQAQAEAARETSAAFLGQVRSFGRFGNRLHTFVLRIGSLFALAHQRPSQSEPEISHFAIVGGSHVLTADEHQFLREAVKWSVLFEEEATKVKALAQAPAVDYVLNPIYAPYFNVTYRKRRKLDLRSEEFSVLTSGTYDQFNQLLRRYMREWSVDVGDMNPSLFSHLESAH